MVSVYCRYRVNTNHKNKIATHLCQKKFNEYNMKKKYKDDDITIGLAYTMLSSLAMTLV